MFASKRPNGLLWSPGELWWVKLHGFKDPIVPVLVEELTGDPRSSEATHYGWWDFALLTQKESKVPEMIFPRSDRLNSPWALLDMCFTYGMQSRIDLGAGRMMALRITEEENK